MKDAVLSLISDDIRLTRITKTLSSVAIETNEISTNNFLVICSLLKMEYSEELADSYYQWIEKESDPEKVYALIQAVGSRM